MSNSKLICATIHTTNSNVVHPLVCFLSYQAFWDTHSYFVCYTSFLPNVSIYRISLSLRALLLLGVITSMSHHLDPRMNGAVASLAASTVGKLQFPHP